MSEKKEQQICNHVSPQPHTNTNIVILENRGSANDSCNQTECSILGGANELNSMMNEEYKI